MINTTAPLFTGDKFETTIKRQQAELYSRLYYLMAEDFITNTDIRQYIKLLTETVDAQQEQLNSLFEILSDHTHNVPPHTHTIQPHTHISSGPGSVSSPNTTGIATNPTSLTSQAPLESSSIRWNTVKMPQVPNTSGTEPNLQGSSITVGMSLEGPLVQSKRRLKTPEILNRSKTIPPLLKPKLI